MMKSAPQSCGKNLLVRVSARRFFAREASPQTEEAFARDGHSPQGDIYGVQGRRTIFEGLGEL
jgi:hypothetical protein